ncbi:MAG: zinc-binding dehydrogenase, partial [Proteobacteria bacterium]|nr:zinc-binding dehydrogenase [Pseudomonadota bacterium]
MLRPKQVRQAMTDKAPNINKWLISKAGSLGRLKRVSDRIPAPEAGEVQIEVKSIGLNFADIFACLGLYSATPEGAFTPGLEFSGIVKAVGREGGRIGVPHLEGDRVMGVTRFGAYATHLNIGCEYVRPLPEQWTFAQGAALPVQGLTAWYGLTELGNLQKGHLVLVQSAAGGVGLQALDVVAKKGALAIAVVGSEDKKEFLMERAFLDSNQIVVRKKGTFHRDLKSVLETHRRNGFDIVFDAVYGRYFKPAYQRLNPMGRYVLYGAADMMTHGDSPNYLSLIPNYLRRPRLDPLAMIT